MYKLEGAPAATQTLNLINDAIRDLTAISRSLNFDLITQQGFLKASAAEVERIGRSTGLKIIFEVGGEPVFLSADQELFLFRMVQEAFNNVLKHAGADEVHLHINYGNGHIDLTVQDNGKGFDLAARESRKGVSAGLQTMDKRVRQLGGEFSLYSQKGEGTRLFITLPFAACSETV